MEMEIIGGNGITFIFDITQFSYIGIIIIKLVLFKLTQTYSKGKNKEYDIITVIVKLKYVGCQSQLDKFLSLQLG